MPTADWYRFLKTHILTKEVCRAIPPNLTIKRFGRGIATMLKYHVPPDKRGPAYCELLDLLNSPVGWNVIHAIVNEQVPEQCK